MPSFAFSEGRAPKITFKYSSRHSVECDTAVQSSWAREARANEWRFAELWRNSAPTLFDFFFLRFHGDFSQSTYQARLSACPSTVSYSRPLVLNVSRFLRSYVGAGSLNPDCAFVVLVFHELMHNWVDDNLASSKMLERYAAETRNVKIHLHLMAIEQYVYSNLGKHDLLGWIAAKYPAIGGDYARAWEIVNREGYEALLQEFEQ